jgi:hypothetical protein
MMASEKGNTKIVTKLLEAGEKVDLINYCGSTSLMYAS